MCVCVGDVLVDVEDETVTVTLGVTEVVAHADPLVQCEGVGDIERVTEMDAETLGHVVAVTQALNDDVRDGEGEVVPDAQTVGLLLCVREVQALDVGHLVADAHGDCVKLAQALRVGETVIVAHWHEVAVVLCDAVMHAVWDRDALALEQADWVVLLETVSVVESDVVVV